MLLIFSVAGFPELLKDSPKFNIFVNISYIALKTMKAIFPLLILMRYDTPIKFQHCDFLTKFEDRARCCIYKNTDSSIIFQLQTYFYLATKRISSIFMHAFNVSSVKVLSGLNSQLFQ